MCGIVGCFDLNGRTVNIETIKEMTAALRHRGPDGEGYWVDDCIGLGHTRLAIVDLTDRAAQPMHSRDKRFTLTYNGEIYNYRELRKELEALGHIFYSTGDTEVLLVALMEWGEAVIPRLNGMFAFGFWDRREKSLLLARDRYGIKPLYLGRRNSQLVFGSEIKALIVHPVFGVDLDHKGLLEYFTFQNFFSTHTLFKDIQTFPAGHTMTIDFNSREPRWNRYWNFHFSEPDAPADRQQYAEELNRLFQQAVNRQTMGDVELGAYLSSGMDSGAITAIASLSAREFKTFTCGFDMSGASEAERSFDERAEAEALAARFGTEHYQVVLKEGDMHRCLPRLVYALDEPRVGQSYPNFYASKLASRFVKVVLAGTGGDELFAGYPWRYYRAMNNSSFNEYVDSFYLFWQRLIPNQTIKQVFNPIWDHVKHVWTRDIFYDVFNGHPNELRQPEDYINHSLYFEAKTFLHGLLIVEDKLSMAHGLECRVPFLDNDLVDFATQIPVRYKLGNLIDGFRLNENEPGPKVKKYYDKTQDGKLILRQVMEQFVGKKAARAVKQGFSGPDSSWFKDDASDVVRDTLLTSKSPIYTFFDKTAVQKLIREHLTGKVNRRLLIWSLLSFDLWCRQFLNLESRTTAESFPRVADSAFV